MFENNDDDNIQEEETVTEEKQVKSIEPFTLDDATEESASCVDCDHKATCPIIVYVNKLSMTRDGVLAENEFACNIPKDFKVIFGI